MIKVSLTPDEIEIAALHAVTRRANHHRFKRKDGNVKQGFTPWGYEVEAACAEMAYCKSRGIYWSGIGNVRSRDGGNVEIRWTRHLSGGLIAYEKDHDDVYYILVVGCAPNYRIIGFLLGSEAKSKEYWMPGEGYYLTPGDVIHPIPFPKP